MQNVIFITSYAGNFNGRDYLARKVYGSELACVNVAKQLSKWYNVTVFVNDDIDLVVDLVRYVRWSDYEAICSHIPIEVCIVSRYLNVFIYNTNYAKKTYLWAHDTQIHPVYDGKVLPDGGMPLLFNLLPTIDKIVCVGKTQMTELFMDKYHINADKLCYIPNGITLTQDNFANFTKRRNSFVFCSSPDRYLSIVLRLFPKITALLGTDCTLDIYYDVIPDDCRILAENQANVVCHGKIPQDQLFEVLKTTEYWLYPTKFFETCCTIAFETAYYGCLQITSNIGAMKENIKGIVIKDDPDSIAFETELLRVLDQLNRDASLKQAIIARQYAWARQQTWENRGLAWKQLFETGSAQYVIPKTYQIPNFSEMLKDYYVLPYHFRKMYHSNKAVIRSSAEIKTECDWFDAMESFVDSNDEYLLLGFESYETPPDIVNNQIKCYFISATATEPQQRKFSETLITDSKVMLSHTGATMVLDYIKQKGISKNLRTTIYQTFNVNSRMLLKSTNVGSRASADVGSVIQSNRAIVAPSIGCVIMVKNEAKVIEESLDSVVKYVNCLIIYDTGSTDDTKLICQKFADKHQIPYYLKTDHTFVDFATNRNIMLKFADDKADYLLMLDAADILQNGAALHQGICQQPEKKIFNISQCWSTGTDSTRFVTFRLIKTGHQISYDYPVHEVLCGKYVVYQYIGDLTEVVLYQNRRAEVYKSRQRWIRDRDLLEQELVKRPRDHRVLFYLAQTYKCLGLYALSIKRYRERIACGGYIDEVQQAYIDIYTMQRDRKDRLVTLQEFWKTQGRGEAAYFMAAEIYNVKPIDFDAMYNWALKAYHAPKPTSQLWFDHAIFDYNRYQMLAIACCHHPEQKPEILALGYKALQIAMRVNSSDEDNQKLMKEYYIRNASNVRKLDSSQKISGNPADPQKLKISGNPPQKISGNPSQQLEITAYVINLARRSDRYKVFQQRAKLPTNRWDAVDGLDYRKWYQNDSDFRVRIDYLTETVKNPFEIACAFSHWKLWKHVADNTALADTAKILIFEDDVYFGTDFTGALGELLNQLQSEEFDVVYIGGRDRVDWKPTAIQNWQKVTETLYSRPELPQGYEYDRGAFAYLITKKTARALVDNSLDLFTMAVDKWLFEKYLTLNLKVLERFPHMVHAIFDESTDIQGKEPIALK